MKKLVISDPMYPFYFSQEEEEETWVDKIIKMQIYLMEVTEDYYNEVLSYLYNHFGFSVNDVTLLAQQIVLCSKYHPKSIKLHVQLIKDLDSKSDPSNSLKYIKSKIASQMIHEFCDYSFLPFNNAVESLLYHLMDEKVLEISEVMDIIRRSSAKLSVYNSSVCSIFCQFAPEIKDCDAFLYRKMLQTFRMHLQFAQKDKSIYTQFLNELPTLQENKWEILKEWRKSTYKNDPVLHCLQIDDVEELQILSSENGFDINQQITFHSYEPSWILNTGPRLIQVAAFYGSIRCFRYLLLQHADTFLKSRDGYTLVQYAIAGGDIEIVRICDQNQCNFSDSLHFAAMFHRFPLFQWINQNKIYDLSLRNSEGDSILYTTISTDNYRILDYCLKYGLNPNEEDDIKMTLLHYAVNLRRTGCVMVLLAQPTIDVNAMTTYNMTPLHVAIKNQSKEIVEALLSHEDINVNIRAEHEMSPLHLAVEAESYEIVNLLLNHQGIDINAKNDERSTPLTLAIKKNLIDISKLIKRYIGMSSPNRPCTAMPCFERPLSGLSRTCPRPRTSVNTKQSQRPTTSAMKHQVSIMAPIQKKKMSEANLPKIRPKSSFSQNRNRTRKNIPEIV